MLASNHRLQFLLQRYLQNQITADELKEFWQLFQARENDDAMRAELINSWDAAAAKGQTNKDWDLLLQQIYQRAKDWEAIQEEEQSAAVISLPTKDRKLFNWKRIAVAASILIAVSFGLYVISNERSEEKPPAVVQTDIPAPDKNRAQIKLSDGSIVYLDSAANGQLTMQNNVRVVKTADGKILYEGSSLTTHDSPLTTSYNTLSNPRGSIVMHMTLSDGSKVWLNAGSSITYPVAFAGNQRKVTMTGEGYFEIAHNKSKPFIVSANNKADVTVLGTHFNVNSYDDEEDIKVTLLEGSIQVSVTSAKNSALSAVKIRPGQQAVLTQNSELRTNNSADIEQTMAWKNGQFSFVNTDLKTVMKQIARWYDVEIVYEGQVPLEEFNGGTSRQENVSALLKVLEATGKIKFRVEGKKVIVSK